MRFKNYSRFLPIVMAVAALSAQMAPQMKIEPQATVKVKRGTPATVTLKVSLPAGFHANSNKPTDPNLIPLTLKWTAGPLQEGVITYPKPQMEEYGFTAGKPISVVTGAFDLVTKFKVPAADVPRVRRHRPADTLKVSGPAMTGCASRQRRSTSTSR